MGYSSTIISRIFSFLHAFSVSGIAIYILFTRDQETLFNPGEIHDFLWATMFSITSHYLAADLILMLIMPTKGDLQYILHHIVGGLGIFLMWKTQNVWLLGLFFELTEVSTLFLNITWYYVHFNVPKDKVFYASAALLLLTFIGIRWIGGGIIIYYLFISLAYILSLDLWIQLYIFLGTGVITILNILWGCKLISKFLQ